MKIFLLSILALLGASFASAQTYNPYLPDSPLINYSGDNNYQNVWINWYPRESTGPIGNTAQCGATGLWGNPGTYQGFWLGGALGYHAPANLPQSCGPLTININATELVENSFGWPDHLAQGINVRAVGSLNGGVPGGVTQYEACSLVGDDNNVGEPHTLWFNPGLCVYYGGSSPM